jgi:hypothetical protein
MLFGWLLLGEHVGGADLIGIVPVALGIFLVTRVKASPSRPTSPGTLMPSCQAVKRSTAG